MVGESAIEVGPLVGMTALEQRLGGLAPDDGIGAKVPAFTSPFGDVFFRARDGVWYLDLLEATLTRPWADAGELKAVLRTPEGRTATSWPALRRPRNARASRRPPRRSSRSRPCWAGR